MKTAFFAMAVVAAAPMAQAGGNGEHPALVARRVIATQGYDYASAFYLHPAGLSLATTAPGPMKDQPRDGVAGRKGGEHPAAPRAVARK